MLHLLLSINDAAAVFVYGKKAEEEDESEEAVRECCARVGDGRKRENSSGGIGGSPLKRLSCGEVESSSLQM